MDSDYKNKLVSLIKKPDVLIFDPAKRSRVLVISCLFLFTFIPAKLLLDLHSYFIGNMPNGKEIVFGLTFSFFITFWWMKKRWRINFPSLFLNKINRSQAIHELNAMLIFLIYFILILISGGILVGFIGFIVYLFQ